MNDEGEFWARARSGDADAFADLFDEYRNRVYGQALRLTRSVHDAEDVTALVFLEAWRRRASVRVVENSILPWLLVTTNFVAKNQIRAMRRHRTSMLDFESDAPSPDFAPDVDDRLDASDRESAARQAFAALSKKDQDVITLCVIEELTVPRAAEVLGIPQGTVKSRLSRAKDKLASTLTDLTDSPSALGGGR